MVTDSSEHEFWCYRFCYLNQPQNPAVGQNVIFPLLYFKPLVSPYSGSFWPSTECDADCPLRSVIRLDLLELFVTELAVPFTGFIDTRSFLEIARLCAVLLQLL